MNLSEALGWMKTLKARHAELIQLRNNNTTRNRIRFAGQPEQVEEPTYSALELDKTITRLAREIRLLDQALKRTNAMTKIDGYAADEAVLGELV